ncbi:FAD-linked oxidoreductase ZEB1 [Colletotrichum sp. SAR 10_77]|nr:FAD-linked oxidoreductase ZEB1 [Colletotrichum sp. SAR 10_77]
MRFGQLCAVAVAATKLANASDCKCAPGDFCWPSDAVWTALNETISGRLLKTVLPGSVCYKDQPNYDEAACQAVLSNWTTAAFHSSDPVSVHSPSYANNSCNPIHENGTSPSGDPLAGSRGYTMGRYPAYSVNVISAEDVQAAVKFAREHNLRLNVKNTGHGSSKLCSESPALNSTTSTPQLAMTFGAGIQDDEAFRAAAEHEVVVVGGTNAKLISTKDVGLVGWAVAGGHGWLTSEYNMGADSIIEATVVTPTGDIIIANECKNSDVFWAIRGGGGGTFGVITELTVKAHPMPQATTWILNVDRSPNTTVKDWWSLIAELHAELPALKAGGFQGFYTVAGPPSYKSLHFSFFFFIYNKPNGTAEALAAPVLSKLKDAASEVSFTFNITYFTDWFTVYEMLPVAALSGAAGGGGATVSRLIPAAPLTDNVQKMAQVLEAVGPRAEPPSVAYAVDDATERVGGALRSLAPDSGAYINEADDREPDWQKTFWGRNYDRLREIKKKYDPDSIQWCHRCVGSED